MAAMPRLLDFEDKSFSPFIAELDYYGDCADPHTPIAEVRRKSPVIESSYFDLLGSGYGSAALPGQREFLALGYNEVVQVLGDPETYSNDAYRNTLGLTFGETLSIMNPPDLLAIRRIFQAAFAPRTIARWGAEVVDPVVASLLDPLARTGRADLVQDFTQFYPFHVIYGQLGLPADQRAIFHKLAASQTLLGGPFMPLAQEAARKLGSYFSDLIELKRKEPGHDLVSILLSAEVDGEKLPDEVIISFLRQLINAAGDTTFRGTSVLLAGLLQNPDQLAAIAADRTLVAQAVEEALRWETPSMVQSRFVTRDVVLGGIEIPQGSRLEVFNGAANRDETIFENPERFDIFRTKRRNLAFGHGPHICIGQHLARLEMNRALNAVLDRMPGVRLDPDAEPPVIRGCNMRYPRHLHVIFEKQNG